ncbi:hypothetical protein niasHT_031330 [Heterodera trifolii]|uniref:Uncharacterized protein n=1 Tax=Heterodera trifolii TaxID=157864 RepID=A0ABD2IUG3_9BILA
MEVKQNNSKFLVDWLFHGLEISYVKGSQSTFKDLADFQPLKASKRSSIFTELRHKINTSINRYENRSFDRHKKELDEEIEKCQNDLLKAMGLEDREVSIECIKGALFLQMFQEAVKEKADEELKALNKKVSEKKEIYNEERKLYKKKHSTSKRRNNEDKKRRRKRAHSSDDDDICKDKQKLKKSLKAVKGAKSERDEYKKNTKLSKSSRGFFHSLRKSFRSKSSKDPNKRYGFMDLLKEMEDTIRGNEFFMKKMKAITNKAGMKEGGGFDALDKYYAKEARLVFAKGSGQDFLRNIIDLSKWMTAKEVRDCAEKFKWIRGLSAKESRDIEVNGSGKASPVPVGRRKEQSDDSNDGDNEDNAYGSKKTYDDSSDAERENEYANGEDDNYHDERGSGSEQRDDDEDGSGSGNEQRDEDRSGSSKGSDKS